MRWPDGRVNAVPTSALGRDQRTSNACPSRSTTARPEPTLRAYGGREPYSRNREVPTTVYWMTTVAPPSWPPSTAFAGTPSIHTSQRPAFADQRKVKDAAG